MMRLLLFLLLGVLPCSAAHGLKSPAWLASVTTQAPAGSAPDAPTDLTVYDDGGNWNLGWTDASSTEDGFEARRSTDGGATVNIGAIPGGATSFAFAEGAGDTHSYRYELRATNAFGQSAWVGPVYTVWTYDLAYWNLEEAAGSTRDDLVNPGFTLDETGGTVAQAAGKNNNAASFSSVGGHYLKSVVEVPDFYVSADFSISFWIYCTALPIGVNNQILVREAGPDIDLKLTTAGNLVWEPTGGSDTATQALGTLNAWHFVVVVGTDTYNAISVDGAAFTTGAAALTSGDDYLYVCAPFGMLLTLNGRVDELAIYNFALAQADVTVLYNAGTGLFR